MADRSSNFPQTHQLPYRSWRSEVGLGWRRFSANLTRENVISNLKTLAWVIPLTLLIWIWAEREQVQAADDVAVPFELTSIDPNRVISLRGSQDMNLVLKLSGPQARLQDLLNKVRGGQMPQGLKLDVPTSYAVNQDYTIPTIDLVSQQHVFSEYGVTVESVQPPRLEISIDKLVDVEAKIVVPPSMKNVDATFVPPMVKVRGPSNLLSRAARDPASSDHGELVVFAEGLPRTPGTTPVADVVLAPPDALRDDRVEVNDAHVKVRANVTVSQASGTYHIASLPVTIDEPVNTSNKFDVQVDRPAVQNVTVIGPPDIIDAMQKPDFEPPPKARLVITASDLAAVGEKRSKPVVYDLPKGVDVSPDDQKKTVDFRIVDRSATPAS